MTAVDPLIDPAMTEVAAPSSAAASASPIPDASLVPQQQQQLAPQPPPAVVRLYSPAAHAHLVLYLAALHGSRITADNLSGSFAPPLHHEKLLDWWKVRLATSAVFLLLRAPTSPTSTPPAKVAGPDLVGAIMLRSHPAETSPHVAAVELLLVNLQYRQLGGERQLLQTVEQQAILEGRTLLTAETEADSSMAAMFAELGFTEAGRIPGMVLRPSTGEKRAQAIFYKDLTQTRS